MKTKKTNKTLKVSGKLQLIAPEPMVKVTRSFTYPVSMGQYMGNMDFFASQTAECKPADAEKVSAALYEFVKNEVLKSVNQFKALDNKKVADVSKESAELDS